MKTRLRGAGLISIVAALIACHPVETRGGFAHVFDRHSLWSRQSDGALTIAPTLDCPERQGDLSRTAVAADGKSCQYRGDEDQDVILHLLPLDQQSAQAALAPIEGALRAIAPAHVGHSINDITARDQDRTDAAKVELPGLRIDSDIDILGAHIKADGDAASIATRDASVRAGPGGAELRTADVGKHSDTLAFVLAGDAPGPSGYCVVGHIARGPTNGPLVVGEFRSRNRKDGHDHDLERLVDRNLGPAPNGT